MVPRFSTLSALVKLIRYDFDIRQQYLYGNASSYTPMVTRIKESYPQTSRILCIDYIMASRMVAGDILGAVFEDESSSGSDDEHGDDIYRYLGEPVLRCDDLEADSLALYEPSALDDTCMGNMFCDAVDDGAQDSGTDSNGGSSERDDSTERDSHGEAPSRHTTEREDIETTGHTDEIVSEIKCQLNR